MGCRGFPHCGLPCDLSIRGNPTRINYLRKCYPIDRVLAGRGEDSILFGNGVGGRPDAIKRLEVNRLLVKESLNNFHRMTEVGCSFEHVGSDRGDELQQNGMHMYNIVPENGRRGGEESIYRSDARGETLSCKEMMERWEFLKHLPHKLLRDIGYVIVGPSLLLNCTELPAVSMSMLGADRDQWAGTKAWLQQLSIPSVEAWFLSHKPSNRLGDHFALCIEYVLRHSPLVEVQRLLTSQQVLQRVTQPTRTKSRGNVQSELVMPGNGSCHESSMLVRSSSYDGPESPLTPPTSKFVASERRTILPNLSTQNLESTDLADKNSKILGATSQEKLGKRKRKLLRKLERIRLRKGCTNTIGEFDFLFETPAVRSQCSPTEGAVGGKKVQHWEVSVKYLLYAGPWEVFGVSTPERAAWSNREMKDSAQIAGQFREEKSNVRLCDSIVGPSELCSLESKEGEFKSMSYVRNEVLDLGHGFIKDPIVGHISSLNNVKEVDKFLGCFLGPHVGETLLDRKARLCNQLALSANPCAASMLRNLFSSEVVGSHQPSEIVVNLSSLELSSSSDANLSLEEGIICCTQFSEMKGEILEACVGRDWASAASSYDPQEFVDNMCNDTEVIKDTHRLNVAASALLKGYLFYEYNLWRHLESRRQHDVLVPYLPLSPSNMDAHISSIGDSSIQGESSPTHQVREGLNEMVIDYDGDRSKCRVSIDEETISTQEAQQTEQASLNMSHWMGWWTRDITEFAYLPIHQHSMWYIIPKLEWLSPVIVPEYDVDRCVNVLSLQDFVVMATRVADEAAKLEMPKKRRFLVAELRWEPYWKPNNVGVDSVNSVNLSSNNLWGNLATSGAWLEVSRGFVVEETWPVSKLYRPHGYVVSWSPRLQQQHLDIPDM